MEGLFSGSGVAGILAAIAVLLAIHIITRIGEFLWALQEKKDAVTESGIDKLSEAVQQNTRASERLEHRIANLETTFSEMGRFKIDVKRLFLAVKNIAGDKWPDVRREIMEEEPGHEST